MCLSHSPSLFVTVIAVCDVKNDKYILRSSLRTADQIVAASTTSAPKIRAGEHKPRADGLLIVVGALEGRARAREMRHGLFLMMLRCRGDAATAGASGALCGVPRRGPEPHAICWVVPPAADGPPLNVSRPLPDGLNFGGGDVAMATGLRPCAGTAFGDGATAENCVAVRGIFAARTLLIASKYMSRPEPLANVRSGPSVRDAATVFSYRLICGGLSLY